MSDYARLQEENEKLKAEIATLKGDTEAARIAKETEKAVAADKAEKLEPAWEEPDAPKPHHKRHK